MTSAPVTMLGARDRFQPVVLLAAIGVGLGLARAAPGPAARLGPVVSVGVFVLLYLVMLGVDAGRVAAAFRHRRFLLVAVVSNFVVNPALAWGLGAVFLRSEPDLRIGLLLFLVTPCIGWYLVFTELAGGDAPLGVSLLGLNVILQVLLLPGYLYLLGGGFGDLAVGEVIGSVARYLVAPILAAAATRSAIGATGRSPTTTLGRLHLADAKIGALVIVIFAMFASQADALFDNPGVLLRLAPPLAAFFALAFIIALAVGHRLGLAYEQVALLVFTTTSRNSEASLAVAVTAFTSPLVGLTVAVGPILELPLLVVMVRVLARLRPRIEASAPPAPVESSTALRVEPQP